jgi:hypothetical protein
LRRLQRLTPSVKRWKCVGRLYPTSGERIITDLDVLVPAPKLPEILQRLAEIGYQVLLGNGKFAKIGPLLDFPHHHYPPVYHPDWPVTVELHVQPVVLRYGRFLTNEELFRDATSFHCRGADLFLPAPDHLVVHNIIHAFLVDTKDAMRKMSLRQSFELVLASRSYAERIDWGLISQRFDTLGYRLSLRQYLALSNICFGQHLAKEALIESQQQAIIRTYLMRMNLQNRYVNSAINLVCYFIVGSRHLLSHPTRIKRLLNADFYFNLRNVTRRL